MKSECGWGYAAFGKDDGFEIKQLEGVLKDLSSGDQLSRLSHAIQLRLEDIRIYPGDEMLGCAYLNVGKDTYKIIGYYQYQLDQYKRDGYKAVAVAVRNGSASAADLAAVLQTLMLEHREMVGGYAHVSHWQLPQVELLEEELPLPRHQGVAYLPIFTVRIEEKEAFIEDFLAGHFHGYTQIFASANPLTLGSIDQAKVKVLLEAPYWSGESPEYVKAYKESLHRHRIQTESTRKYTEEAPTNSLVYAFDRGSSNQWQSKKSSGWFPLGNQRTSVERPEKWIWVGVAILSLVLIIWLLL